MRRYIQWGLLLLLLTTTWAFAQDDEQQPSVTLNVISSEFNTSEGRVNIDVGVKVGGRAIAGLGTDNFSVDEPSADLQSSPVQTQSITTYAVVDLANGGNGDLIRETLKAYVTEYYNEGETLIFQVVRSAQNAERREVSTSVDAYGFINGLRISEDTTRLGPALDAIYRESRTRPDENAQVLVVGSYINNLSDARESANDVLSLGVPISVVQAHNRVNPDDVASYRRFANGIGANYVNNEDGIEHIVQDGDTVTAVGDLQALYQSIAASRTSYRISYRPVADSADTNRTSTLRVDTSNGSATTSYSYEITFGTPQIEVVSPTNLSPLRTPNNENGSTTFDTSSVPVYVDVDYTGGPAAPVETLRLEVLDAQSGQALQPVAEVSPSRTDDGTYTVDWSLEGYTDVSQNRRDVVLSVTMTDALGQSASTEEEAAVLFNVGQAQITFTPQPTFTPRPTFTPQVTFTPQPTPGSAIIPGASAQVDRFVFGSMSIAIVGLLGLLGGGAYFLTQTETGRGVAQGVAQGTVTAINQITSVVGPGGLGGETNVNPPNIANGPRSGAAGIDAPPVSPAGEIYGTLELVEGPGGIQRQIPITKQEFIVGRDIGAGCDFEIPIQYVSGTHAAFITQDDTLYLVDRGGADRNGTWVNDQRMRPDQKIELNPGSIVKLSKHVVLKVLGTEQTMVMPPRVMDDEETMIDESAFEGPPAHDEPQQGGRTDERLPARGLRDNRDNGRAVPPSPRHNPPPPDNGDSDANDDLDDLFGRS